MKQKLVLLDFDGTLTKKDTLFEFIRYYHGTLKFVAGFLLLSPMLVLFKVGLIANDRAKQITLQFFFGNIPANAFNKTCGDFAQKIVPTLIKSSALQLLKIERQNNSTLVVVSASPENWVKPWCDTQQLLCIATRLEVKDNKITGNIEGKNCFGKEKVNRIKEQFSLTDFKVIAAYGDSKGDREMLALAHEPNYRTL
jgi:phosphatidylglycerophosphatase C